MHRLKRSTGARSVPADATTQPVPPLSVTAGKHAISDSANSLPRRRVNTDAGGNDAGEVAAIE
eukprot:1326859-Rhodomonas_salina.1